VSFISIVARWQYAVRKKFLRTKYPKYLSQKLAIHKKSRNSLSNTFKSNGEAIAERVSNKLHITPN